MYASTILTTAALALASLTSAAPFELPNLSGSVFHKKSEVASTFNARSDGWDIPNADFEKRQVKPSATPTGSAAQTTSTATIPAPIAAYIKALDAGKIDNTIICQYNVTRGVVNNTKRVNMFWAAQNFSNVTSFLYALPRIADPTESYTIVPLVKEGNSLGYVDIPVWDGKPYGTVALYAAGMVEPISGKQGNSICYFEVDEATTKAASAY